MTRLAPRAFSPVRATAFLPMSPPTVDDAPPRLAVTSSIPAVPPEAARALTRAEARDLLRFARRRLTEERLPQVAASLTFTTTLALVPLLTIVLAIFTTFPMFGELRLALDNWFVQMLMPKAIANTIMGNLTQFASKATGLSAVGGVALLFTSSALIGTIERAFNQIWRVRQPRPIVQRVLVYWALVTLGPLVFGVSVTITSQLFTATNGITNGIPFIGTLFYTAVSVALLTAAYTLLYMIVPSRTVDWRDAAWGGLLAALAFEIAKRVFAVFIRQFPTYSIIYGALAALPLFLLWLYLSWMITLVGALLASALPVVKYERWWYQPVPGGAFVDAMAILKVLYGSARLTGTALVSSSLVRAHTRIGYDEMGELLQQMVAAGWVGRVQAEEPARQPWSMAALRKVRAGSDNWVLLVEPGLVRVADVYRLFAFGGAGSADFASGPAGEPAPESPLALDTAALARQVEAAVEGGLEQTLAAHFGAEPIDSSASDR